MSLILQGERLREARRFRQLSITELAENVGVSKQMISKYERNESIPSIEVYQKIISNLEFPLKFFQQKDKFELIDKGTFYRSRLTSTQSEKKPSEMLKKYLTVLCDLFDQYVEFPTLEQYEFSKNPQDAALQLRNYWELGNSPIQNMMLLLEKHGFRISSVSSTSEKVDAFGSFNEINGNRYYCILIDKDNNSFYRQQYSLAHELGHWVLHSNTIDPFELSTQEYRRMEEEADIFASNFLMPESSFLIDINKAKNSLEGFISLKEKWNVSIASMLYRARSLNVLSAEDYIKLQKRMSYKRFNKVEPFDSIKEVPRPLALKQTFNLLIEAKIFDRDNLQTLLENHYGLSLPDDILADLIGVELKDLINSDKKIVELKKFKEEE